MTARRPPCAAHPDLFITPGRQRPTSAEYKARVAAAKAICSNCIGRDACRDLGRAERAEGVWGGEDDVERTAAGHRPVIRRIPPACGTEAGAKRHRRRNEIVCPPCRKAADTARTNRIVKRQLTAA